MDINKIRLMTKLARYEIKEENHYIRISHYFRRDYIGISLIGNFFSVTVAWLMVLSLIVVIRFDTVMQMLTDLDIAPLVIVAALIYVIMLAGYTVLTYLSASGRYKRAEKSVKSYKNALEKLERMYEKKDDLT